MIPSVSVDLNFDYLARNQKNNSSCCHVYASLGPFIQIIFYVRVCIHVFRTLGGIDASSSVTTFFQLVVALLNAVLSIFKFQLKLIVAIKSMSQ